jgi:hypothetical protein
MGHRNPPESRYFRAGRRAPRPQHRWANAARRSRHCRARPDCACSRGHYNEIALSSTSRTKHERAARWYLRSILVGCRSGGGRSHSLRCQEPRFTGPLPNRRSRPVPDVCAHCCILVPTPSPFTAECSIGCPQGLIGATGSRAEHLRRTSADMRTGKMKRKTQASPRLLRRTERAAAEAVPAPALKETLCRIFRLTLTFLAASCSKALCLCFR